MKTQQEIEEMAKLYADSLGLNRKFAPYANTVLDFGKGYSQAQKDLLESAPKDFDYEKWSYDNLYSIKDGCYGKKVKELFISLSLKNQKIIQEKDQKIAELERSIETLDRGIKVAISQERDFQNELQDKYDQAVKDIKFLITIVREIWMISWQIEEIRKRHGISEE